MRERAFHGEGEAERGRSLRPGQNVSFGWGSLIVRFRCRNHNPVAPLSHPLPTHFSPPLVPGAKAARGKSGPLGGSPRPMTAADPHRVISSSVSPKSSVRWEKSSKNTRCSSYFGAN